MPQNEVPLGILETNIRVGGNGDTRIPMDIWCLAVMELPGDRQND